MHDRRGGGVPGWIEVHDSNHALVALFARGHPHDQDAVVAGLSSTWSSGQVEARITRVKLIKRAGYGRTELLRTRIRLRTGPPPHPRPATESFRPSVTGHVHGPGKISREAGVCHRAPVTLRHT